MKFIKKYYFLILFVLLLLLVTSVGSSVYLHLTNQALEADKLALILERDALDLNLASTTRELAAATTTIAQLEEVVADLEGDKDDLKDDLRSEKDKNDDFQSQIKDIAGTVGVLDKLSKTDKELLQKYSKVYFLNEHYVPESLKEIEDEWKYDESRDFSLHSKVMPYFKDMVEAAKDDDVNLWVVSAYRSFDTQAELKGDYTTTFGSGANTFSADQGYSEHQLGTTIDFTTSGINGGLDGFDNTEAYNWLVRNAYKYGFTLSYPEENGYYIFEPWHWRFVGTDLADDLRRDNAHFYDWEQRKIDEYLVSIFD